MLLEAFPREKACFSLGEARESGGNGASDWIFFNGKLRPAPQYE